MAAPNIVELEVPPLPGRTDRSSTTRRSSRSRACATSSRCCSSRASHIRASACGAICCESDANVDLVHFTILRPPEKQDVTPINELSLIAFPTADLFGRKINEFDLIIFDRYSNQTLLPSVYFDNIARYVRQRRRFSGGRRAGLREPRGLYYSPLGDILPARPDGALFNRRSSARVSDGRRETSGHARAAGRQGRSAAMGRLVPPGRRQCARAAHSSCPARDDKPLLVLSHEGKGRVALLLTDQMWLWARGFEGGGPHRRSAAPPRALADEGARSRRRGAARRGARARRDDRAPNAEGPGGAGDGDGAVRAQQSRWRCRQSEPGLSRASLDAPEMGL